ncbi:MAG: molybdate ABC transporter permease subunit [Bacteroidia bacterium]|nr:molybdate ABC transporter permease subunit [Bacteroidia bacterium]
MIDWQPIFLTLKLAGITSLFLLIIGIPLAYWMAYTRNRIKPVLEALIAMPLVLPPTVLGFYLLVLFSKDSPIGQWLDEYLELSLIFSFEGLVLASMIYSLPFMVQPLMAGFSSVPNRIREAARVLGKSSLATLIRVLLPMIRPSIITATILSFAHTMGEFGVVLMIGGSISGETKVASIAIYEQVEKPDYPAAHSYSLILISIAFAILFLVYYINGRKSYNRWEKLG